MKEKHPSKKIRVAVIGGGASGWSAAETLRDMDDAFDITVYERNTYFGGKCCTVLEDGSIANGRPGGYEMGAGVVTPGSRVYEDTMELIDKSNLKVNLALPRKMKAINYFRDGDDAWHETHPVSFYNLTHHPGRFFRGVFSYLKFGIDMLRFQRYRVDMANSPKQLAQTMSERYPVELNAILSVFMQGYGYAHESDPRLTPPMLYYHQYMQPDMMGREKIKIDKGMRKRLYKLETGTQGIWDKISRTYPDDKTRLNEKVTKVRRNTDSVSITTTKGTEEYDYAIMATSLKQTLEFMDFYPEEEELVSKMKYNHYVTVLCKAENIHACCSVNIPVNIDRKRYGDLLIAYKRYKDSNIIVAYLYVKTGTNPTDEEILDKVETGLKDGFNARMIERSFAKVFHWDDYFGHLEAEDIVDDWYDRFNKTIQGKNNTLFVSSGLHMEIIGSSVQYSKNTVEKFAVKWLAAS